jgi:hypothetical protein
MSYDPAPPRKSNRSFLIAAALMAAATAVLLIWRFSQQAPAPPPEPPPAPIAQKPAFETPPPPPPPIEEEPAVDAGRDALDDTAPARKTAAAAGLCAGACRGRDTAELRAALAGRARQSQGCYERALRQNPTLTGQLMVRVKVGPKGELCTASIASDGLGEPSVASCVLQKFRSASFPAPAGGCAELRVPINFMPKP